MRILLLGEYSALFSNLKDGLIKIGHEVRLYADGDSWKRISGADQTLFGNPKGIIKKIHRKIFGVFFDNRLFDNYDAVILINFDIFHPSILHKILKKIKKKNKFLILCSCGHDEALYRAYKNNLFKYHDFDGLNEQLTRFNGKNKWWKYYYSRYGEINDIEKYVDLIIPSYYECLVGYKLLNCRVSECIPFPISVDSINYKENEVKDKIIIFHGLNREIEKGSPYILNALKFIQSKYPDKVEIIVDGKMPYAKYVDVISKTNIVIDQCKSYSYGMNACICLAQGKVVFSGARDECLQALKIPKCECPIISISPNVHDIVEKLENLIANPHLISVLGRKGRDFINKYHDAQIVADKYVKCIESINRIK